MGSFLIQVSSMDKQRKIICLQIFHMSNNESRCDVVVELTGNCNYYSFGRRKSNNFYSDD